MSVINSFNDEYITYSHSIAEKPLQYSFSMHAHEHHEVYCFYRLRELYRRGHGVQARAAPYSHHAFERGAYAENRRDIRMRESRYISRRNSSERLDPECRLLRPFL